MPKPCHRWHSEFVSTCRICVLYETRLDYRKIWDASSYDSQYQPRIGLCIHLGGIVAPEDRPDLVKDYRICEKGHGTVCPCGACRTCADYVSEDESSDSSKTDSR